jgi:hypothetical protein
MDGIQGDVLEKMLHLALNDPVARFGLGVAVGIYLLNKVDFNDAGTEVDDIMEGISDIAEDVEKIIDIYERKNRNENEGG